MRRESCIRKKYAALKSVLFFHVGVRKYFHERKIEVLCNSTSLDRQNVQLSRKEKNDLLAVSVYKAPALIKTEN